MPLSFAPMSRGAFTGFQMIFLFRCPFVPEAERMQSVLACPMNEASGHTQPGKPGRMTVAARWYKYHRIGNNHTSFVVVCPFHASGDVFFLLVVPFLRIFSWSFFYPICLCFRLPPFCAFQWAASVSHFRSGRKGNSGIGRESKVKPPVFGKNLQPCG